MAKEKITRIVRVSCSISKDLYDEIKEAQKTLNSIEHQRCIGKKKQTFNFVETSQRIGKYLKSQRRSKKQMTSIFDDWF